MGYLKWKNWIITNQVKLALIILLMASALYGQVENIRFDHISIKEGLSQVSVNCILQDKKGFMWFGTQDGLNRYNGYDFVIYRHNPDDKTTISDNFVWSIFEDQDGMIWIGTFGKGLDKFDPASGIFTHNEHDAATSNSLSNNDVRCILEDKYRILWIGTHGGGLNKFDRKTNGFVHYTTDHNKLSNNNVTSIFEDRSGVLWIGTYGGGLNRFDRNTGEFIHYKNIPKNNQSLSGNKVMSIFEDRTGTLWVGTEENGLNKFDKKTGYFECYKTENRKLKHDDVRVIYEDRRGALWIGTSGGLNKLDGQTGKFIPYTKGKSPNSLSNDDIRCIYEDPFGVFWVGTRRAGINKFYQKGGQFILYTNDASNKNSLSHNTVMSIYYDETDDILWIGTFGGGLNKLDRSSGRFTHYMHEKANTKNLSHNEVRAIHKDRDGMLWVGTYGGGLNKFDTKTEKFEYYKNNNGKHDSLSDNYLRVIHEDRNGVLWIGTENGGLNKMVDRKSGKFIRYTTENSNINDDLIYCIYEDRSGVLWFGTRSSGLTKLDNSENMQFKHYKHDDKIDSSISHNSILSIYEDKRGILWIGTDGGLNKFDRKKKFTSFRIKNGLPNEVIYGILEDKEGNLWLSTNKGISKFNPITGGFRNYDVEDGLQSNEFNAGAYFKNEKTGEMFFGGIEGFNTFSPEQIKDDLNPPSIVISDFFIANKPVKLQRVDKDSPLSKPVYATDSLTLSSRQNFFSFEFAALHYASPRKNRYQYKMEGWDNNWIGTDWENRRATYNNLPAGNYTFKVKGTNKDGIWNEDGTSIKVKILPPPWKTWWAYSLYILVVGAILFLICYVFYQRKKSVYERYIAQVESMAALGTLVSGVAHEINNPSTFNQTSAYNLEKDIKNLKAFLIDLAGDNADTEIIKAFDEKFDVLLKHMEIIKEGTSRINKTVSDLRTFSRVENGEMRPVKLQEGLQITINLVKTQYKDQVEFIIDFQGDPEVEGNAAELNRVFMNVMINACQSIIEKQKSNKEIVKGTLTIKTRVVGNEELISFQDTGIGMSEEVMRKIFEPYFTTKRVGEGTGLGLSISYKIIEKHKGQIKVTSRKGVGTTITLYLPIKHKHVNTYKEVTS
jgi:two-component system sensor histidine kinase ChiS